MQNQLNPQALYSFHPLSPLGIGATSVYWKRASYFSPHGSTGQVPSETQQEPVILTSVKLLGNDKLVARRWGALDRTGRCLVITREA